MHGRRPARRQGLALCVSRQHSLVNAPGPGVDPEPEVDGRRHRLVRISTLCFTRRVTDLSWRSVLPERSGVCPAVVFARAGHRPRHVCVKLVGGIDVVPVGVGVKHPVVPFIDVDTGLGGGESFGSFGSDLKRCRPVCGRSFCGVGGAERECVGREHGRGGRSVIILARRALQRVLGLRLVLGLGLGLADESRTWLNSARASTSAGSAGFVSSVGLRLRSRRGPLRVFGHDAMFSTSMDRRVDHFSESDDVSDGATDAYELVCCEYTDGVSMSTYPAVDVSVIENADFCSAKRQPGRFTRGKGRERGDARDSGGPAPARWLTSPL